MVGGVHRPVREARDQPAVDRARGELSRLGPPSEPRVLAQQPGELGPGEVGIEHEPGAGAHVRLLPGLLELATDRRGAAVLPDDRGVDRSERLAVPHDHGLALVRDADGAHVGVHRTGLRERLARHPPGHLPDLDGVVLDPAGTGEVLRELRVAPPQHTAIRTDHEAGGAGRPLVDRQHGGCAHGPASCAGAADAQPERAKDPLSDPANLSGREGAPGCRSRT